MGQIQITIPMGTFTVYNATDIGLNKKHYHYYDVDTGFLLKADNPIDGIFMVLQNSSAISEFPTLSLPILIIALPLTMKYFKSFIKKL